MEASYVEFVQLRLGAMENLDRWKRRSGWEADNDFGFQSGVVVL